MLRTGFYHAAQRDEEASPLSYAGSAPFVTLGFTHRSEAALFAIGATAAIPRLTSAITRDGLPTERTVTGQLTAGYYRQLAGQAARRSGWLVGASLSAQLFGGDHHYDDAFQQVETFGLALLSLSPEVMWEHPLGRGALSARVSVPLVALAWRSYSDLRRAHDLGPQLVSVGALQAAACSIGYSIPIGPRVDALASYSVSALAYADGQPSFTRLNQHVGVGIALRLGAARP